MNNKWFLSIAYAAFFFGAAFLGFKFHQFSQGEQTEGKSITAATQYGIGQKRPDFNLMDLQGQQRHISEWDGKVLVVNFWATWCPPCRDEIPGFMQLQDELAEEGLQFLGIALETAEDVLPFYQEVGVNYPTLVGEESVIRVAKKFGNDLGALPYTVIMDRQGKIAFIKRGPLSIEDAREEIKKLL